jgi:transcriptional regulator
MSSRGMFQTEIAEELGIPKSNISIIEGQAKANIEWAKNTMKIGKMLQTPHLDRD